MKYPDPPYYVLRTDGTGILELDTDGSFEECEQILTKICDKFSARAERHMETGPCPYFGKTVDGMYFDKDKGYWYIYMGKKRFFLMRNRGFGACIWLDLEGDRSIFLEMVKLFEAVEFVPWHQKVLRFLGGNC